MSRLDSNKIYFYSVAVVLAVSLVFCQFAARDVDYWWLGPIIYANLLAYILIVIRLKSAALLMLVLIGAVLLPSYTILPYRHLFSQRVRATELHVANSTIADQFFYVEFEKEKDNILIRKYADPSVTIKCYGQLRYYRQWFCEGLYQKISAQNQRDLYRR